MSKNIDREHSPQIIVKDGEQDFPFSLSSLSAPLPEKFPVSQLSTAFDQVLKLVNAQGEDDVFNSFIIDMGLGHWANQREVNRISFKSILDSVLHAGDDRQPLNSILLLVLCGQKALLAAELGRNQHSVHFRDAQGRTLLMLAAARGDTDVVNLLLASGADPLARCRNGCTALMYALNGMQIDAANALLSIQPEELVRYMVGMKDNNQCTALHNCIHPHDETDDRMKGLIELAGRLVDLGASLSAADEEQVTPLIKAAKINAPMSEFLASKLVVLGDLQKTAELLRTAVFEGDKYAVAQILANVSWPDIEPHTYDAQEKFQITHSGRMTPEMVVQRYAGMTSLAKKKLTPLLFVALYKGRNSANHQNIAEQLIDVGARAIFNLTVCWTINYDYEEDILEDKTGIITAIDVALATCNLGAIEMLQRHNVLQTYDAVVRDNARVFSDLLAEQHNNYERLMNITRWSCAKYLITKTREFYKKCKPSKGYRFIGDKQREDELSQQIAAEVSTKVRESKGIRRAVQFFDAMAQFSQEEKFRVYQYILFLLGAKGRNKTSRTIEGSFVRIFLDKLVRDRPLCELFGIEPRPQGLANAMETVVVRGSIKRHCERFLRTHPVRQQLVAYDEAEPTEVPGYSHAGNSSGSEN